MDVPDVRRRVRAALEQARRDAAGPRERSDAASRAYDEFLTRLAVPLFQQLASALVAERHRFKVFTPAGSVRLASERSPEDFVELVLDTTTDPPSVLCRTSLGRGRHAMTSERPVSPGSAIESLSESAILDFVLAELLPLIAR
jgi:hypothetical protein